MLHMLHMWRVAYLAYAAVVRPGEQVYYWLPERPDGSAATGVEYFEATLPTAGEFMWTCGDRTHTHTHTQAHAQTQTQTQTQTHTDTLTH